MFWNAVGKAFQIANKRDLGSNPQQKHCAVFDCIHDTSMQIQKRKSDSCLVQGFRIQLKCQWVSSACMTHATWLLCATLSFPKTIRWISEHCSRVPMCQDKCHRSHVNTHQWLVWLFTTWCPKTFKKKIRPAGFHRQRNKSKCLLHLDKCGQTAVNPANPVTGKTPKRKKNTRFSTTFRRNWWTDSLQEALLQHVSVKWMEGNAPSLTNHIRHCKASKANMRKNATGANSRDCTNSWFLWNGTSSFIIACLIQTSLQKFGKLGDLHVRASYSV